jgi:hypothetical protein
MKSCVNTRMREKVGRDKRKKLAVDYTDARESTMQEKATEKDK